jgi:alpha-tubulin suppressor-like RCC1 family protein
MKIEIPNLKAKQVSTGSHHTVVIDLNDNIWVFGQNITGQLGLGDYKNRYTPTQIPKLKAKQVSAGMLHTLLMNLDDNIWAFGNNLSGQLGIDNTIKKNRYVPITIPSIKAKQICAGGLHSIIIDVNDNVWVTGYIFQGLSYFNSDICVPTQIRILKAKQVSAGGSNVAIIDLDDNIWVFYSNGLGQLGIDNIKCADELIKIPDIKAKQVSANSNRTIILCLDNDI